MSSWVHHELPGPDAGRSRGGQLAGGRILHVARGIVEPAAAAARMNPVRLVQVVGARPQFIKLAPWSRPIRECRERRIEELIVHTGQHYDPHLSDIFFQDLDIPCPSANLEVGSGSHGPQTAAILERAEVPVAHIEAGLRSRNRAMPEEFNRVATDLLSDLLLAPTDTAIRNLAAEGLAERSHLGADVMYDAVLANAARARRRSCILDRLGVAARRYSLVTIHRAERTHPAALPAVLELLAGIASSLLPLVFPVHPRTRDAMRNIAPDWQPPPQLVLITPVGPLDTLCVTEAASVVLTDSGELQKEAFMLGCPYVTLRSETEWVETAAAQANTLVAHDPGEAAAAVQRALAQAPAERSDGAPRVQALYGQGDAAARCLGQLLKLAEGALRGNGP